MKITIVQFICTKEEKENLRNISKKIGLNPSNFCRLAVFKKMRDEELILKQNDSKGEI